MPLTVENGILQHKPKKAEIKRLTNDLAKQQHALARKEAELADLRRSDGRAPPRHAAPALPTLRWSAKSGRARSRPRPRAC